MNPIAANTAPPPCPNPNPSPAWNPTIQGNPHPPTLVNPSPNLNPNITTKPNSDKQHSPCSQTKSFADLFSDGLVSSSAFSVIPLATHKGTPSLKLSKEAIESLAQPFKWTLVGKFSYGRPTMEDTRIAFSKFNLKGTYKLGQLDAKHLLIQLTTEEDYQRLWMKEVWYVRKYPMRTLAWSPSWRPEHESPIVPVWVGFPGLPVHLFNRSFLFSMARAIGPPLSLDKPTAELTRPSIAKVLIQVDVTKKLPSDIFIDCGDFIPSFFQKVEYDNLPRYCKHCSMLGHEMSSCKRANPSIGQKNEVYTEKKSEHNDQTTKVTTQVYKEKVKSIAPNLDKAPSSTSGAKVNGVAIETEIIDVTEEPTSGAKETEDVDQNSPNVSKVLSPINVAGGLSPSVENEPNDLDEEMLDDEIILENPDGTLHGQNPNQLIVDEEARIMANIAAYRVNHPETSAPTLRPSSARTPNPKYFNSEYINPKNLKEALTYREKCDSEPDGGISDASSLDFDDDGFQKVKRRGRKKAKEKKLWKPTHHSF